MNYIFTRDGKAEKVVAEKWGWGVVYAGGGELHQFDTTEGIFHQFQEIDQSQVTMFVMYNLEDPSKRVDMPLRSAVEGNHLNPLKLFHGYVRRVLDNDSVRQTVYLFGWEDVEAGTKSYTYILPDDRIIVSDWRIQDFSQFGI